MYIEVSEGAWGGVKIKNLLTKIAAREKNIDRIIAMKQNYNLCIYLKKK